MPESADPAPTAQPARKDADLLALERLLARASADLARSLNTARRLLEAPQASDGIKPTLQSNLAAVQRRSKRLERKLQKAKPRSPRARRARRVLLRLVRALHAGVSDLLDSLDVVNSGTHELVDEAVLAHALQQLAWSQESLQSAARLSVKASRLLRTPQ